MSGLAELIARCEAATGADRELDVLIAVALELELPGYMDGGKIVRGFAANHPVKANGADYWRFPKLTAFLDAVLALMAEKLPGWEWRVEHRRAQGEHTAGCEAVVSEWNVYDSGGEQAFAPTPALALLAAALRALDATPQTEGATDATPS